jgi:NADP-dependent 3-hydroxy acid dehydrogenase YdfG
MNQLLSDPNDVAKAVLYAVTKPIEVNVVEIVVRPPKVMSITHLSTSLSKLFVMY